MKGVGTQSTKLVHSLNEVYMSGLKELAEAYSACKELWEEALGSGAVYHPLGFDIIYADQNTNPESQKIHCYMISTAKSRFNFDLPLTRNMTKEEIETATLTGYENLSKVWCETTQEWILDEEHCQGMDLSQYAPMRERGLIFYPNAKLVQIYAGYDQWSSSEEPEISGIVVYAMKEEDYSMNEGVEPKLFEQASGTTAPKAYTICKVSLLGYGSGKIKADPDQFVDVCKSLGFENYGEYVQVGDLEVANFEDLHKEYAEEILDTFNLRVEDVRVEMKHSGVNSLSYQVEYLCPEQSCQLVFRVSTTLESADSIKSQIESLCDGRE